MRIAVIAAGFSHTQADELRRSMASFRRNGKIKFYRRKFIEGMVTKKYSRVFAERCFSQIEGFGEYGFPESHAASFANLVYASAWLKGRYPDVFAAALLNSQPMGFYAPAQLVQDARDHGVEVRPVDVNLSDWDCGLEPEDPRWGRELHPRHISMRGDIRSTHALRLGLRQISGLSEKDALVIESVRGTGFDSIRDLWLRTGLKPSVLERLAAADAFRSLGFDRRDALWAVRALQRSGDKDDLPLFARVRMPELEPNADLPPMLPGQQVVEDYRHLQLSLKAHPVSFLRAELDARGAVRHAQLPAMESGTLVTVAGLVLVRQRPGTAKGVIFLMLEDETGIANTIVWARTFEVFRQIVLGARLIGVTGKLQKQSGVIHIIADRLDDLTPMLRRLSEDVTDIETVDSKQEPALINKLASAANIQEVMPKGRNFH
jgi:error-prone DNA polymerase